MVIIRPKRRRRRVVSSYFKKGRDQKMGFSISSETKEKASPDQLQALL